MTQRHPAGSASQATKRPVIRPQLVLIVLFAAAATGYGLYRWQIRHLDKVDPTRADARAIPPRHSGEDGSPNFEARPSEAVDVSESTAATSLARKRATPLPPTLLTRPSDDGEFWYVGKPSTESLVEIPFPPGYHRGEPPALDPVRDNPGFLGAQACQSCHAEKYESFIHTAHHLTSQPATPATIRGSFQPGENRLRTANPDLSFTMIQRGDRCYQKVDFYDWEFEVPIDLVVGSSKLAQTFLYWDFDALYQMNVTHLTQSDRWINSPGYFDGDAAYARPIAGRCIECHSTYIDLRREPNHFTPNSLILGISCERCHGPGRPHVEHHLKHPADTTAQFVTVPADLPRDREMDVCGQCHSGASLPKGLPYTFRPGDRLEDHYHPMDQDKLQNSVHASNQASRLALSQCFRQSQMACSDCHDPHRNEHGQLAIFSSRCLECHTVEQCGQFPSLGDNIRDNCIDCHMPQEATENLRLETPEGNVFPPLRDHLIRVDADATKRYLEAVAQ